MMTKFPHLLAAVEARAKHEKDAEGRDQWAIGAAVIKDCDLNLAGRRGTDSHDGSGKRLEAASKELAKHGHPEYHAGTLRNMAATTAAFPASRRYAALSFNTHYEAKSPDILDWIVGEVGIEGLSKRDVRAWVNRWHQLQANKHREKVAGAKADKKAATTLEEKRAATKRLKELGGVMPTPKAHLTPPDKESQSELAAMADILSIDSDAVAVAKTLRGNLADLRDIGDIPADFSGALIEHHEAIVEVAKQIVSLLKDAKRGRFSTIEGGKAS